MNSKKLVVAVLDTNVIFPIVIRDILFWFAHFDIYKPKWTADIFNEWKRVMLQKGVDIKAAEKRMKMAETAFPFARVDNYSKIISQLTLPDANDRHILAAAIKAKASIIVTNNNKDFPKKYLARFGINVQTPDMFLNGLMVENPLLCVQAFKEMVLNKRQPVRTEREMLQILHHAGIVNTAKSIEKLL
ncbi:MAG: PIN domain-containing protein [Bacteroidetes bacterium]|nr:MAG: PIN domain-containing protein [Bacteroidota bacterium]TAE68821.1 MAG: PIN domain-containing protein [Bacteroidota bacterium]TAF91846.1 MAG: PIN domain-containing protein [Bacteroidota bacterium]